MGKIEDMQRLREQQYAERVGRAKAKPPPPANVEIAKPIAAEKPATSAAADVTEGKCPDCGKTKPVQNGVMASHQKGFGKACPGSRKPPA